MKIEKSPALIGRCGDFTSVFSSTEMQKPGKFWQSESPNIVKYYHLINSFPTLWISMQEPISHLFDIFFSKNHRIDLREEKKDKVQSRDVYDDYWNLFSIRTKSQGIASSCFTHQSPYSPSLSSSTPSRLTETCYIKIVLLLWLVWFFLFLGEILYC